MTLDVVGFASGSPLSVLAMRRLAREHRLRGIVVPEAGGTGSVARSTGRATMASRLRGLARRMLQGALREPFAGLDAPRWTLAQACQARCDAMIVASFPARLPPAAFAGARLGAFNLHMSLLPRHRGVDPVFSTYWDDDRDAGISVHWLDASLDTGPVAARRPRPLPRGLASRALYAQLAQDGVEAMSEVLQALADGRAARVPQDAAGASYRSSRDIARLTIPAATWPAERAWHVLAGLGDQRHALLATPHRHGRARGFEMGATGDAGRIEVMRDTLRLHCSDGVVDVERMV